MSDEQAAGAFADDLFCPECGYNLRGLTSERCPECGFAVDKLRTLTSNIPWIHRRQIGWLRAYWRTVWMAVVHPARLADEIARPVSFAESQRFRWATVLHAYFPFLLATIVAYAFTRSPFGDTTLDALFVVVWPVLVIHVAFLLFLGVATGLPSYFFHPCALPERLQNRAVALSYYACGTMAWTFLPVVLGLVTGEFASAPGSTAYTRDLVFFFFFAFLTTTGMLLQFVPWWRTLRVIARRTMPDRPRQLALLTIAVPALWMGAALLTLAGFPLLVAYVVVIGLSLS